MTIGLKQIVIDGLTRGYSAAEIIAANPGFNPRSIHRTASRARKELGFRPLRQRAPLLPQKEIRVKSFIKDIVDAGLRLGMTNAELIAANPQFKAKSIADVANRQRRKLGILVNRFPKGPGLQIPIDIRGPLDSEAAIRDPGINVHGLVLQLLRIIVTDNLFDAILGEPA